MVENLKRFATKRNLTILMVVHFALAFIGSIIYFAWLNNSDVLEWFGQPYAISSTVTHMLGYVTPVILLCSIRSMDKESSEKIFVGAIITGLTISVVTSFIVPAITGSAFSGGNLIGSIILKIPAIFIIVDIYRKYKLTHVSCILCVVMAVLQIIAFIINIINASRYGVFYTTSIMPAILSGVHWVVLFLYLIRFVKTSEVKKEEPIAFETYTAEQRLLTLKAQYDNGEITEEEYREIKEIILQSYVGK